MTIPEALEIIEELSVLKFFPAGSSARAKLATMLEKWCKGDIKQARWLVDHGIDGMDEYPGPDTLRKLIADKFRPSGPLAPYVGFHQPSAFEMDCNRRREGKEPEVLPALNCELCEDSGTVMADGRHAWCSCHRAIEMQRETPGWLEMLNRSKPNGRSRLLEEQNARRVHAQLEQIMGCGAKE